jgi:hypothetical protein
VVRGLVVFSLTQSPSCVFFDWFGILMLPLPVIKGNVNGYVQPAPA